MVSRIFRRKVVHCALTAACIALTACQASTPFDVELLFTHEGCRVYRFKDDMRNHYYSDCRDSTREVSVDGGLR